MFEALSFLKDRRGNNIQMRSDATGRTGVAYEFRDITSTGRTVLTRAQEGTIIAGVANTFIDLIAVTVANSSTQAVAVDLRASTAGGIQDTIEVPAGNTIVAEYVVPIPQDEVGTTWTAQMQGADISDSPVTVSMIAIKNT